MFFTDVCKAWLAAADRGRYPSPNTALKEWRSISASGSMRRVGAYVAKSMSTDESVKFVVRLQRRFSVIAAAFPPHSYRWLAGGRPHSAAAPFSGFDAQGPIRSAARHAVA